MTKPTSLIYNPPAADLTFVKEQMPELVKARLAQKQLRIWQGQLTKLLGQIGNGEIALIEFTKPRKQVLDIFTRIRIRRSGPNITMAFVHVFHGEHAEQQYGSLGAMITAAMAEVERWTGERSKIGANFLTDINEGLAFVGYEVDTYAPAVSTI